jgi:hypothetical protein
MITLLLADHCVSSLPLPAIVLALASGCRQLVNDRSFARMSQIPTGSSASSGSKGNMEVPGKGKGGGKRPSKDNDDDDVPEQTPGAPIVSSSNSSDSESETLQRGTEDFETVAIEQYRDEIQNVQTVLATWAEGIERSKYTTAVVGEIDALLVMSAELLSRLDLAGCPESGVTERTVLKDLEALLVKYNELHPVASQLLAAETSEDSGGKRLRRTASGD